MKIVWHKHNLINASSVGSGHPQKYSSEISRECLPWWGNLSVKITTIKGNHWFNLGLFSNGDFTSPICNNFYRTALFLEKLLFHTSPELLLRQNSCFFRAAISSEQLLFWGAPFSEQSLLHSSYFLRIATFSEQNFYRKSISRE